MNGDSFAYAMEHKVKSVEEIVESFGPNWLINFKADEIEFLSEDVKKLREIQKNKEDLINDLTKKENDLISEILKKSELKEGKPEHALQRSRLESSLKDVRYQVFQIYQH